MADITEFLDHIPAALPPPGITPDLTSTKFTPNKNTWLYWSYVALLSLNVGFWVSGGLAVLFACTPREKIWNPLLPGTCIDQSATYIASGAWNVFTDFCIIVLPLFSIWKLRLAIRYKIGISIMFLTTIFTLVASIVRLFYTVKLFKTVDVIYVECQLGLWTIAEMSSLVCCSCMPVFPRLYRWLRGRDSNTSKSAKPNYIEFTRRERPQSAILSNEGFAPENDTQVLVNTQVLVESSPRSVLPKHDDAGYECTTGVHINCG